MKNIMRDMKSSFHQGMNDERKKIAVRREKAEELRHLTDSIESLTGNRDINAPLKMAIRLMTCGVDPKDIHSIDVLGAAYAAGIVQEKEAEFAKELAIIEENHKEKQS